MSNTTYIDLSYYDLPNINLDNINSFYTYGQELINLGVESSIVNEIYKEEKWDDIEDYNLAINKLENSNTYKKIDFLNKFKCDIDNKNILISIAAYKEAENIENLITEIRKFNSDSKILII